MHAISIAATFLASALLSAATPTPTLVPRACSTVFPTVIDLIDQAMPNSTTDGMTVTVALDQAANSTTLTHRDALVIFNNIPAGAYGCQLEAIFPAGAVITSSGVTQVNVFSLNRVASPTDTYATAPNNVGQIGIITFSSSPTGPTKQVINSAACSTSLSYRLSLASDANRPGSVTFQEIAGAQGLQITFNC